LIKLVTRHVLAGRPATEFSFHHLQALDSLLPLRESVPMKQTHEGLQSGVDLPPPRPIHRWPMRTASSCQVHSHGDNYFGGILIFLVIS
jgi:hypothetical protein